MGAGVSILKPIFSSPRFFDSKSKEEHILQGWFACGWKHCTWTWLVESCPGSWDFNQPCQRWIDPVSAPAKWLTNCLCAPLTPDSPLGLFFYLGSSFPSFQIPCCPTHKQACGYIALVFLNGLFSYQNTHFSRLAAKLSEFRTFTHF